ncbi:MAG: AEC family transporter [Lachnospiraceae bacterium]|nr:AEC family transporter [Lachnospiraceae bacterium]
MSDFVFSINVTMPIFLVILLGYILRKFNLISDEFVAVANKYVFMVALPIMLFQEISTSDVRKDMNVKFFLFCLLVTIIMFALVWVIAAITLKDKTLVGAFAQAGARGSAAVLGVAFVENICGDIGMTPLMIVAAVPFFNMISVVILVFNANGSREKNKGKIKDACINIAKNPIIIGILSGLIISLLKVDLPVMVDRTMDYIGRTATPIALIAIGGGFDTKAAIEKLKPALGASFIKLIGLPAVFLPIAYILDFGSSEMVAILMMLAAPTTVSCYIMAKNMDNDEVLTSNVIVLTTLLSSVTLTMWVFVLKTVGCI